MYVIEEDGNEVRTPPQWILETTSFNRLVVQGHLFGEVTNVFRFRVTTDIQVPNEEAAHLHNLRNLLHLLRISSSKLRDNYLVYAINREEIVLTRSDIERVDSWIMTNYLTERSWAEALPDTLHRSRRPPLQTPLEEMLTRLKQPRRQTWTAKLLRRFRCSHHPGPSLGELLVVMCNYLATSRQSFFFCQGFESSDGNSDPTIFAPESQGRIGICLPSAEVSDQVIYVPGVSSLLIARCAEHADAMLLTGPTVIARIHRVEGTLRGWERRNGGWFYRRDEGFPLTVKGNARKYTLI